MRPYTPRLEVIDTVTATSQVWGALRGKRLWSIKACIKMLYLCIKSGGWRHHTERQYEELKER